MIIRKPMVSCFQLIQFSLRQGPSSKDDCLEIKFNNRNQVDDKIVQGLVGWLLFSLRVLSTNRLPFNPEQRHFTFHPYVCYLNVEQTVFTNFKKNRIQKVFIPCGIKPFEQLFKAKFEVLVFIPLPKSAFIRTA